MLHFAVLCAIYRHLFYTWKFQDVWRGISVCRECWDKVKVDGIFALRLVTHHTNHRPSSVSTQTCSRSSTSLWIVGGSGSGKCHQVLSPST